MEWFVQQEIGGNVAHFAHHTYFIKMSCWLHHISQLTGSKKLGCQYAGQRNLLCLKHFSVHSKLLHNSKETSVQNLSLRLILILHSTDKENRVVSSNKCSHDDITMFKNIKSDSKNLIFSKAFNTSFTDADNMDTSDNYHTKTYREQNQVELQNSTLLNFQNTTTYKEKTKEIQYSTKYTVLRCGKTQHCISFSLSSLHQVSVATSSTNVLISWKGLGINMT